MKFEDAPLLIDVMPDLVEEFSSRAERWFREVGENPSLRSAVNQLSSLRIVATCDCRDDFCGTFFVSGDDQPIGPPSRERRDHFPYGIDIAVGIEGDGRVYQIHVLGRPEFRARRDALGLPPLQRLQSNP